MPKLNETFAKKVPHSTAGTEKHWDTEVRGLVLFVGKRSKTWYFQKDVGGQTRRVLIGRYPIISAEAARQSGMALALDMARGVGKSVQSGAPTVAVALEAYLARPKLRSEVHKHGVRLQLGRHLKDWLRLPLTEITKAMAVQRHREMAKIPSGANHTLRQFRSVWNHARRTFDLPECPTVAIEWYGEAPSGQMIDDLPAWAAAVDELDNPIHAVFYRLILFTGFRKGEALALEWKHVHDDRIHLPMTKNGRSFDLPIVDVHHEILRPLRRLSSKWVFPSPKASGGHLTSPERMAWTAHSHRRTFATVAMESRSPGGNRWAASEPHALVNHRAAVCSSIARCAAPGDAHDVRRVD